MYPRRPNTPFRIARCAAWLLLLGGCVSDGGRPDAVGKRTHAALLAAGDADSLAAAAMLDPSWQKAPEQRVALIARASAAEPGRADLVWLHLQICRRVTSCDSRPVEAELRRLDPGNAAAWAGELERNTQLADPAQIQATLVAMGNAERFDIYWNSTIVHLTHAIAKAQSADLSNALVSAIGVAAAEAIPAFQPISHACRAEPLDPPETIAACRKLAAVLRRGDTYITEMMGLALARRVWPSGSPEQQEAIEARRIDRYRMDAYTRLTSGTEHDNAFTAHYLEALSRYHTEQEVLLAEIVRAGLDPNPGKDWRDTLGGQ